MVVNSSLEPSPSREPVRSGTRLPGNGQLAALFFSDPRSTFLLERLYQQRVLAVRRGFDENLLATVGPADSVVVNGPAVEGNGSYLRVPRHWVPDGKFPQRDV